MTTNSYRGFTARKRKHRRQAAAALGRRLRRTEVVHHHSETQLVICENQAYHLMLHQRMRVLAAGGDPNTQRFCARCDSVKPVAAFKPRKDRPSGRESTCRACRQ